jgi:hypothetical protein
MSFYLGVWNGRTVIFDDEAVSRYLTMNAEKSVEPEFNGNVYVFYSCLTDLMVPKDELSEGPWACGIHMTGNQVIMAIQLEEPESGEERQ